jgi:hypothetical protein
MRCRDFAWQSIVVLRASGRPMCSTNPDQSSQTSTVEQVGDGRVEPAQIRQTARLQRAVVVTATRDERHPMVTQIAQVAAGGSQRA